MRLNKLSFCVDPFTLSAQNTSILTFFSGGICYQKSPSGEERTKLRSISRYSDVFAYYCNQVITRFSFLRYSEKLDHHGNPISKEILYLFHQAGLFLRKIQSIYTLVQTVVSYKILNFQQNNSTLTNQGSNRVLIGFIVCEY